MKNIRKILVFIILFSSTMSFGQNKKAEKSPELIARKQVDIMEVKYKLTKEQKESIYLLRVEEIKAVREQKAKPELGDAKVNEIIKNHKEELKRILSEEQIQQLKADNRERKMEHHNKVLENQEYHKE